MSTYWGLHCKSCDEVDTWFRNDREKVETCVKVWPHVREIRKQAGDFIQVIARWCDHTDEIWCFLEDHAEHDLEIANEYHQFFPLEERKSSS